MKYACITRFLSLIDHWDTKIALLDHGICQRWWAIWLYRSKSENQRGWGMQILSLNNCWCWIPSQIRHRAQVRNILNINEHSRDLKPENLLLDHKKNIKIVDFGLSNTYKAGETLKTACGSPCYAAPEMIAGKRYLGSNVDIWSCGVILFAMICGYLPFEDPNTANLYKKILNGDYSIPKFVSQESRDLITNILNTDPEKRYKISDIRKHPWFNQITHQKITGGIFIGLSQIPINVKILELLVEYNFKKDYAVRCINANKHNHVTTSYYLLLKRHE